MSNRLLIFLKVLPAGRQVNAAATRRAAGGCDRAGTADGGGWKVPVDNTINLLPRIVKLRWNFKLDILSENLTPCSPRSLGSYSFPLVSPRSLTFSCSSLTLFPSLVRCSFSIYLSIYLSIVPSLSNRWAYTSSPCFSFLFLARRARHSREQRFHWTSWLTNSSYLRIYRSLAAVMCCGFL